MSTIALETPATTTKPPRPILPVLWLTSILAFLYPPLARKTWPNASLFKASAIALVNLLLTIPWLIVLAVTDNAWQNHVLLKKTFVGPYVDHPLAAYLGNFAKVPPQIHYMLSAHTSIKISTISAAIFVTAIFLAILFFLLLPFAARPGRSKPCVLHVLRSVLLSTGFVHIWAPILTVSYFLYIHFRYPPGLEYIIVPFLSTCCILGLWAFGVLVYSVTREYRRGPEDYPQPRDPTCDRCGYILLGSSPTGNCPECGKPITESLGPDVRLPTLWERRPSLLNLRAILHQFLQLVRRPQQLFFSMPTLAGQPAAHRWLIGALVLLTLEASFLIPAFHFTGLFEIEWPSRIVGGLAVGLVWAFLALMMVGIETAGVATFSRLKGNPVSLATAAKVTSYTAPLMFPWIILGSAQILALAWWWDPHNFHYHFHMTLRMQQILITLSMAIAHIGGLLWFEFTVYSGIRSVQWANK